MRRRTLGDWIVIGCQVAAIVTVWAIAFPGFRDAVSDTADRAGATARDALRRARRIGEPAWLSELRANHAGDV